MEILTLLRLCAFFILSYLAVILASSTWLDASLSLNQRVLGPIQVVAYLVLTSLIYWTVRARVPAGFRFGPLAVAGALSLLVVLPNSWLATRQLRFPFPTPQPTKAMVALAKLPKHDLVVTNEPAGVFVYAHRGSVLAPVRSYIITTEPNPDFKLDVEDVGDLLQQRHGVVALVPDLYPDSLTVGELKRWAGLVVTRRFPDGTVFLSVPR